MMTKLRINRAKWLNGTINQTEQSFLRVCGPALEAHPYPVDKVSRYDGMMCCLGFDARKRGIPVKEIQNVETPEGLRSEFYDLYPTTMLEEGMENTQLVNDIMNVNDAQIGGRVVLTYGGMQVIEDHERREKLLKSLFAQLNIDLIFYGKLPDFK